MLRRGAPFLAGLCTGLLSTALILLLTSEPRGVPIQLQPPPTAQPLRVHVAGSVQRPGVYELAAGAITQNAIDAAGGAREGAVLAALNLAQPLQDGSQIYVPSQADLTQTPGQPGFVSTPAGSDDGERLRVNEATVAELEQLPGIGPTLAQAIVQYREENGPFQNVAELELVPGIGPAKLGAIEDLIAVP